MSTLEIILAVFIGIFVVAYTCGSIYDMKHPEKVKERKERKKQKKEEKRNRKKQKYEDEGEQY